jgi:nucleoside-diphosphate-sugar epimerase
MNVFVAGGSGTIGLRLALALRATGHTVTVLTRSGSKYRKLRAHGVEVAVADALDGDALMALVGRARPSHVVHQLTALPRTGPRRAADLDATNRLRIEGTRNLLDAAVRAGARRLIVGSFAALASSGSCETGILRPAAEAVYSMERQVIDATKDGRIEGVILRYGMLYGLENPSTAAMVEMIRKRRLPVVRGDTSRLPWIHVDDAVSATVQALRRAPAGVTYDIVDDDLVNFSEMVEAIAECTGSPAPIRIPAWILRLGAPYVAHMMLRRVQASNANARAALAWRPEYATMRERLMHMFHHAA